MRISVTESRGSVRVVRFEGVLDRNTVPAIRRKLFKILRSRDTNLLDMDFSGVDSIDTAGLALLLELMGYMNRRGGELRLREVNEKVLRMINLARLGSLFENFTNKIDEN